MLTIVTIYLLFMLVYQTPDWLFLLAFLLIFGATINFSNLIIKFTSQSVSVSYGIFRHNIPWEDIENCCLDETWTIGYGGWGVRIGRVKGKWRLVYNIVGGHRVVLSLKKGKFREFVFSTNNPQRIMEIVKQKLGGV